MTKKATKGRYKKKASTRGGARKGAGRKPFIPNIIIPLEDRQAASDYARKYVSECIDGLMDIARNSENDTARSGAYNHVLNRALGAVPQALELANRGDDPLKIDAGFKQLVEAMQTIANTKSEKTE